jgi:hypothetical protein
MKATSEYRHTMQSTFRFLQKHALRASFVSVFALAASTALAQGTISFPARASDLPDGAFWNMSGDHGGSNARDLNVVRPSGSDWTNLDSNGGSANSSHLVFGVPLYAPVDGEVVSCWRNHPENPSPGTPHSGRCCGNNCDMSCDDSNCPAANACTIARSGNHLAIRKANGDVVLLAHLQSGSVPASICPNNAAFMSNARNRTGNYPKESFLRLCGLGETPSADDCVANRPAVKRGEFVGRAGNSGASSGPHLHLDTVAVNDNGGILEKVGDVKPTNMNFAWLKHRTDESVWKPFLADAIRNPPVIVNASPYLRRADAAAGDVNGTSTLFLSGNRAATATIGESNGNLKLITWDLVGLSTLNRRGEIEAGPVKEVYLGEPLSGYVLAAVRQRDDILKMIAFQVGPTGNLLRRADFTAGRVTALDMATTTGGNRRSVTAVRDKDGNLKLIAWDIELANNGAVSIVRLGQAGAGRVSALSISRAKNFTGVFTAVRDSANELLVIPWKLSANGQSFSRGASGSGGSVGVHLDVAPLATGVAAAVQDSDDKLRIITWSVNSSGNIGQRRGLSVAGDASEVTLLTAPHAGSNLTAVVRGGDGRLYLIGWQVDGDGRDLRRLGSSRAGAASRISADSVSRSGRDMIMTSMRATGGELRLITWDTNLVHP